MKLTLRMEGVPLYFYPLGKKTEEKEKNQPTYRIITTPHGGNVFSPVGSVEEGKLVRRNEGWFKREFAFQRGGGSREEKKRYTFPDILKKGVPVEE